MKTKFLLSLAASVIFATTGHGQIMTPSVEVTGDESILTTGTEVFGGDFTNSAVTLANGVTFQALYNASTSTNSSTGVSVHDDGAGFGDNFSTIFLDDNSNLNSALSSGPGSSYLWFDVGGLTAGATYTVQVFAGMTQGGNNYNQNGQYSGTEWFYDDNNNTATSLSWGQPNVGGNYVGTGVYAVTDTFVANSGGTADFGIFSNDSNDGNVLYNGIVIDEIPAPEPGTLAMLLAGGLVIAGFVAFRRRAALAL